MNLVETEELVIDVGGGLDPVSALLIHPEKAHAMLAFAHGAGADMHHAFMNKMALLLAGAGVATLRYQFPYSEAGGRRIDPKPVLLATVRSCVAAAHESAPELPLYAGGKSMGGRMTSNAQAVLPLPDVRGLVFFGFPLHPAGHPGVDRADHLVKVHLPMLFLQGTRDALAELDLLRPICTQLGARAKLHVVEGADHGFAVLKRSGRTGEQVLTELAWKSAEWMGEAR